MAAAGGAVEAGKAIGDDPDAGVGLVLSEDDGTDGTRMVEGLKIVVADGLGVLVMRIDFEDVA